ncbi:MAG: DUF4065 domain-containing protein [Coprobacillus sp.]|nr:DUF4065 domain-containing protein [Coprobacillus sp.]
MTRNLIFCEECRDDVEYTITEVPMIGKIKGIEYHYIGKEVRCVKCNTSVYVPEINDSNLKALYEVYRKENGIVSLDVILAIPMKYAIGKRPLSLLLGWGEQTFSRYCDGDIPTKQYSEILTKIYDDPIYYAELLEAGKENLKSQKTYEKSRKAVDELIKVSENNSSKINIAIKYLLNQCEDITPLALQKALYYIQGFYYAFYNTFLFIEECEAWVHGPVYRDIYFKYCDYHFDPIVKSQYFDDSVLSASEKAIFDSVINNLCCYSGKVLEQFTHNETPWLVARGDLPVTEPSKQIISHDNIGTYFKAVKEKYKMTKPNDIRVYSMDMFDSL